MVVVTTQFVFRMQAKLDEFGQIEIPEHEVATRRKQFRMKKRRRDVKQKKKAEKQVEKERKMAEKQAKKDARNLKKQESAKKKQEKQDKKEQKQKDQQAKKEEKKKGQKRKTDDINAQEIPVETTTTDAEVNAAEQHAHKPESPSPLKPAGKNRKRKSRGMTRLKKYGAALKVPVKVGGKEEGGVEEAQKETEAPKDSKGTKRSVTCAEKPTKPVKDTKHAKESPKKKQNKNGSKEKTSAKKTKEVVQPDDDIKKMVCSTLAECRDSHCCHPKFQWPELDPSKAALSVYWSRSAVGIKVPKENCKGGKKANAKKAKAQKGMSQVAYFGLPTSCTYTNILLAGKWVSCWHSMKKKLTFRIKALTLQNQSMGYYIFLSYISAVYDQSFCQHIIFVIYICIWIHFKCHIEVHIYKSELYIQTTPNIEVSYIVKHGSITCLWKTSIYTYNHTVFA